MQLTTLLVETLKSGKIVISQNDKDAVEVNIADKKIDANVVDKEFVKEIVSSARKSATSKGVKETLHRGIDTLKEAQKISATG